MILVLRPESFAGSNGTVQETALAFWGQKKSTRALPAVHVWPQWSALRKVDVARRFSGPWRMLCQVLLPLTSSLSTVFVACFFALLIKAFVNRTLVRTGNRVATSNELFFVYLFIYLFFDNLATGGSLTCAILSCHFELSKYSTSKFQKKKRNINNTQNEYTALLESFTTFQKFVNSVKNRYWNGSRRIRHTM